MKKLIFIRCFVFFCAVLFAACTSENHKTQPQESPAIDSVVQATVDTSGNYLRKVYDALIETISDSVKEMQITYPVKQDQEYYFSNSQTKDVFTLYVPMGKIGKTKSIINITNVGKDLLFSDTINTFSLVSNVLYPENALNYKDENYGNRYRIHYLRSINEKQVNEYLGETATTFFDSIFVNTSEVANQIKEDGDNKNKELFKEVTSASQARIFFLLDYDAEEGGDYIGYSPVKKKAVVIFSGD